ncbi:MAG: branched-chain amino acid ABC transporter permease [Gammaproteobacteria bacterium]
MRQALARHRFLLLALAVACALPLAVRSGTLATEVLIYALAALGCNLLLGYTGLMSFGQGIFLGLGSYTAGLLLTRLDTSLPLTLLLALIVGALVAVVVGWLAIRQRGIYFVMLTLAFAHMFYFLAYTLTDWTGGDNGLLNIPRPPLKVFGLTLLPTREAWQYYTFVALVFLLVFWLLQRVADSMFGRTLLAIRDSEARAAAVGYHVKLFKLMAFAISGAVTALAGALYAMLAGIAPLSSIEYHASETILVITVIGGTGNLFASVLGAVFSVLTADWLSTLWPRWLLLLGLLLMAIALYMRQGLWGLGARLLGALRRPRVAATDPSIPEGPAK